MQGAAKFMKPSEKSKNTNELMQILSSAKTPEELQAYTETLKQEHISCSFADFISEKLRERELSAADLIRNSMIQRNYGYQLLNGTRTPSRDKVLAFCLALGLDLTDTQRALNCAATGQIYPKNKRDSVLLFAIKKNLSVMETNDLLYNMEEPPLKVL